MAGIGVIHNPHSRKNRRNPGFIPMMGAIVGTQGMSAATERVDDISEWIQRFKSQEIDILAINGGDGSNSMALTALLKEYGVQPLPRIALLRGGTMNVAANSCGVHGTPAGLMLNLVEKYRDGAAFETTFRDLIEVDGRYGFVFGNGFIASFLDVLYHGKKSTWTAAKLMFRASMSAFFRGKLARRLFRGVNARVSVDGRELPQRRFSAVAASTVREIGLRARPFRRSGERPHSFHMLGITCSPSRIVSSLPKLFFGRKVSPKKVVDLVAADLVFESKEPLRYTLDGENYTAPNTLQVKAGPRLEIIVR